MNTPDSRDDTSSDHERFERALLAQDRDVAGRQTADIDDTTAQRLVNELVDTNVVTPVPENRALVHEPSSTVFHSITQLAVFHRGWTAAREIDAEAE